jgi:hypothetical protein
LIDERTAGTARPVLRLHQAPRSWEEYRDVSTMPTRDFRVIAGFLRGNVE